ncbi:MAG: hypothetical protein ACE5FW_03000 [Candidatus Aenigmatarchaeota archaeon]
MVDAIFNDEETDIPPKPLAPPPPKPAKVVSREPPLFIKVERYKDIVRSIQQLRSYALNLRDALDALSDLEKELRAGLSLCHKALDKFNTLISTLDARLSRTAGAEKELEILEPPKAETTEDLESYVTGLHQQMERIREDLKTIS